MKKTSWASQIEPHPRWKKARSARRGSNPDHLRQPWDALESTQVDNCRCFKMILPKCLGLGACIVLCTLLLQLQAWPGSAQPQRQLQQAQQNCQPSGTMCAAGAYSGEVETDGGLKAALHARSYQQEVVLVAADGRLQGLEFAQLIGSLMDNGIQTILPIALGAEGCKVLEGLMPQSGPNARSCGFYGATDSWRMLHSTALWHAKWRTAARSIRMGYSVLLMDVTSVVTDNVYKFLHHHLLKQNTIMLQTEDTEELSFSNGIIYLQGKRQDAAAQWLAAEMAERPIRWLEDGFRSMEEAGAGGCPLADFTEKDLLNDVVPALLIWRPGAFHLPFKCATPGKEAGQAAKRQQLRAALGLDGFGPNAHFSEGTIKKSSPMIHDTIELPPELQDWLGIPKFVLSWMPTWVPNVAAGLPNGLQEPPASLLSPFYPAKRAGAPQAMLFRQQLAAACPGCPMTPDHMDPDQAGKARSAPEDRILFLPPWLALAGSLQPPRPATVMQLAKKAPIVVQVAQTPPSLADPQWLRLYVRMSLGVNNWRALHRNYGRNVLFLNEGIPAHHVQPGHEAKYYTRIGLPVLVAYHPDIWAGIAQQGQARGEEASLVSWLKAVVGLAQAAAALGGAMVWPAVPCDTAWVKNLANSAAAQTDQSTNEVLRLDWVPHKGLDGKLWCTWARAIRRPCLEGRRGVLPLELYHLMEQYRLIMPYDPSSEKYLDLPGCVKADLSSKFNTTLHRGSCKPTASPTLVVDATELSVTHHYMIFGRDNPSREEWTLYDTSSQPPIIYLNQPVQLVYNGSSPGSRPMRGSFMGHAQSCFPAETIPTV